MTVYIQQRYNALPYSTIYSGASPYAASGSNSQARTSQQFRVYADGDDLGGQFDGTFVMPGHTFVLSCILTAEGTETESSNVGIGGYDFDASWAPVPCAVGGEWADDPTDIRFLIWNQEGELFSDEFDSLGFILTFPSIGSDPQRFAFRSLTRKVIPAGSYAEVRLSKVGFPLGIGFETVTIPCSGNNTFSEYINFQPSALTDYVINDVSLFLAVGVGEAPCLDGEESEVFPEEPVEPVPPEPPPEPGPLPEEPIVPEPPVPPGPVPPTPPVVPVAPETGCDCEIYIADSVRWAAEFLGGLLLEGFGYLVEGMVLVWESTMAFLPDALGYFGSLVEWVWTQYSEMAERHHSENLSESQALRKSLEDGVEDLVDAIGSLEDTLDRSEPVEVVVEGDKVEVWNPGDPEGIPTNFMRRS